MLLSLYKFVFVVSVTSDEDFLVCVILLTIES